MPLVAARLPARGACALVAALIAAWPAGVRAQDATVETAVKATFVTKFAQFVRWPAGAFGSPSQPLVVCVAASEAVAGLVDDAARGAIVDGHPLKVEHVAPGVRTQGCHILYTISTSRMADALVSGASGSPVLTVLDGAPQSSGPVINFVLQGNRVRFEIDLKAAARNGLTISSRLLALAVGVRQ